MRTRKELEMAAALRKERRRRVAIEANLEHARCRLEQLVTAIERGISRRKAIEDIEHIWLELSPLTRPW